MHQHPWRWQFGSLLWKSQPSFLHWKEIYWSECLWTRNTHLCSSKTMLFATEPWRCHLPGRKSWHSEAVRQHVLTQRGLQAASLATARPSGSKSWHSEAVRPSLVVLAIPSTYRGREEDLDIEYSIICDLRSSEPRLGRCGGARMVRKQW